MWRGLLLALVELTRPIGLKTLELTLRSGIGAFQTALRLPQPVEEGKLGFGGEGLLEDTGFGHFHARQFPLRDCHLLQIELCRPRLRLPFAFQIVAELVEFLAVFAGQDNGASAKAVPEGVHADGSLTFGSLGASGFERIATIGVDLMDCCHMVFYEQSQFGAAPGNSSRFPTSEANLAVFSPVTFTISWRGGGAEGSRVDRRSEGVCFEADKKWRVGVNGGFMRRFTPGPCFNEVRRSLGRLSALVRSFPVRDFQGVCLVGRGFSSGRTGLCSQQDGQPNWRRPAWDEDGKLETKNIAFPAPRSGDREYAGFHSVLRSAR